MTDLYQFYTRGERGKANVRIQVRYPLFTTLLIALLVGISLLAAFVCDQNYDELFHKASTVEVIAHRACGVEGVENSAAGLQVAADAGAWGAEIDIQRTADGAYVVNHDDTFARVAGEPREPRQMTLEEVRQLTIANKLDPSAPGEPVPTYEDMLEGSRDKLILFVELKGKTADRQMCDDAVRIAREMGMLDQCVFISLKYNLIDYLEDTYDDVQTGFLAFAYYGDIGALNCDYLALEEEACTLSAIENVHNQDKKVLVWTANSASSQRKFLLSKADAIITDRVTQAREIKEQLAERTDNEVIDDALKDFFW